MPAYIFPSLNRCGKVQGIVVAVKSTAPGPENWPFPGKVDVVTEPETIATNLFTGC